MKISRKLFYRAMEQHCRIYPWVNGRSFAKDAGLTAKQWNHFVATGEIKARPLTKVRLEIMATKAMEHWPVLFKVADINHKPKPPPKGARKCR